MVDASVQTKPQRLNPSQTAQKNPTVPRKFYKNFAFKAIIVIIFIIIVPFFPSEPPEFVTTTSVLSTSWELFQLIFVGIVVSYGLFSRKNDDDGGGGGGGGGLEGENSGKFDAAQSYMSKLLHVTSVFDDDVDNNDGVVVGNDVDNDNNVGDNNVKNVQTWSSKYVRNEPMLVVADKTRVFAKNNSAKIDQNFEKPLLLPVRSLRSRVSDEKGDEFGVSRVYNRSNTSPIEKGFGNNLKKSGGNDVIELGGNDHNNNNKGELGFGVKGHVRSNSSFNGVSSDFEESRPLNRSNSYVGSRDLARFSRKSLSVDYGGGGGGGGEEEGFGEESVVVLPSPIPWQSRSVRREGELRDGDDSSTHSLPPSLEESEAARLLKPPQFIHSNSSPLPRSETQVKGGEDFGGRRKSNFSSRVPPPPPPPPPPLPSSSLKSRRPPTAKPSPRNTVEQIGQSVRTVRRTNDMRPNEVESTETEKLMPKGSFSEYPKETQDFLEQVLLETDDESESEGEGENYHRREERDVEPAKVDEAPPAENVNEEESDVDKNVDKKADEFIAKFREQIRLQRIESIKKSTGQLKRSSVR